MSDIPDDVLISSGLAFNEAIPQLKISVKDARQYEGLLLFVCALVTIERQRCASLCDVFDAPASDSEFVNGQSTAAQQIRASINVEPFL